MDNSGTDDVKNSEAKSEDAKPEDSKSEITENKKSTSENTGNTGNTGEKNESLIKKLRKPKIAGMAAFDWVATAVGAGILAGGMKVCCRAPIGVLFALMFVILVILGILIHYAIGTPTMLNYYLGLNTLEDVLEARKK